LPNDATGVQTDQVLIELSYDIHLVEGADFMPDFQYMIRPDAQKNIPNATVLGFKSHFAF
jgi:porin